MSREIGCYTAPVNRTWVGIDQGSTATKACLVDHRGRVRRTVTVPVKTRVSAPGRVEHDPEALLRSVRVALHRVTQGVPAGTLAGAGLACQRSTCLFWDAKSGKSLTPALSWQDRRGDPLCQALSRHASLIARRTGLRLSPHYAASKLRWLLDRTPGLRQLARRGKARFGTLDSYLLFRLTGGADGSTDPTHAARTLLMNLESLDWDPELLDLFGIPERGLAPIRPSASIAGERRLAGVGMPVAATLGDQQSALLGVGCLRRGEMVINCGTGAFAALNTGARRGRAPGLLTSVAWSSDKVVRYLLEGTVNAAGSAVQWTERLAGPLRRRTPWPLELDRLPIVIPAFAGLGAPHWRSDVGAAIFDLLPGAQVDDLRLATLAGVACRLREIVDRMRETNQAASRIVVAGGLSNRSDFLEILAKLMSASLFRSSAPDATARGAALLAGQALGEWDLEGRDTPYSPATKIPGPRRSHRAERYYRRFAARLEQLLASPSAAELAL